MKSKTPWLTPDQDAPDPVEFALQTRQPEAPPEAGDAIPALTGQDPMAQALMMIADALKTIKAGDAGAATRLASIEQFLLNQEASRPHENLFNPPMVSAYNPDGERDHPRADLKCKMIWVGYELSKELLTKQEITLLNRLEPGVFRVTKADGRQIRLTVVEKADEGGRRETLTIHFPCKNPEDRTNHNSMIAYLREIYGEGETRENFENLLAEIATLKAQVAAQSARA